ncbi:galactose-1-phosphate uridylyltransferase [Gracilibacillus boraciitolerans JCM 21714]|uniref:Galactose-1-phosphate uridylyltransferase n=1 Tax=Gracilibacillus boraciitolerans JCM 21714 TaxID=1298598 RepID=W4VHM0_9BACI|nr:UDP-glucose--hexose-1-phosphate uridylyltransferase [Gracilibacillus boraciitolerans]GAE92254.1 galactose-1-phosphate uridylyltransferase [Gracilibacillus boraciitolerans JCM 21714]
MTSLSSLVETLVVKATEKNLIQSSDKIYARNQILGLLEANYEEKVSLIDQDIPDLLEDLADEAVKKGLIEGLLDEREQLTAKIMDVFMSKPSEVNETFYQKYQESPETATNYFYQLSEDSNYIQTKRIANNIQFKTNSNYGDLDITINLSKPEKDPEQIKREKEMKQDAAYPKCLLCAENEGYVGRIGHPARSNHRIIEVPLEGEEWFLQYSPYVYYHEHCIVFAKEHRPMQITRDSFARLTAFVEKFPHYFVGSNADLPIVGGSILSHDHFQGGRYTFAMTNAEEEFTFNLDRFSEVEATVVKWPLSVIRLRHRNRETLIDAADYILQRWREYSDPGADVLAYSNDTPHNTITPIARKRGEQFELDLVLRNNRTTAEHPMGLFHPPHEDVHHIKKENIGLIEVMGLAVLPPRLKDELADIKKYLLGEPVSVADYHDDWVKLIKDKHTTITEKNADKIIEDELGQKFARVLEDAGVYKTDADGRNAFKRFLSHLNE